MKRFTVTISDEEEKALSTCMVSIQDWVDNAIHNRARIAIDRIITEHTDKQPKKLSNKDKADIIKGLTFETAVERNKRSHEEMLKSLRQENI